MRNQKTTIHDIAHCLSLSSSTVSRALNGSERISKKTREQVRQMAVELKYNPNQTALNLRKGIGTTIGVIVPRLNRNFFSCAIAGMEAVINPTHFNLIICQSNEDYEMELKNIQSFINQQVSGILISVATGTKHADHIALAMQEGIPVVLFDRMTHSVETDQVINDNFSGAYEMTTHLIGQGYRKIFHFSGPLHVELYQERYNGYRKAIEDASLPFSPDWVFHDVLTRAKGEETAREMIEKSNLPDAVFAASDFSALGAQLVFKQAGIKIPGQIGIAGFANEPFTELTEPGMTTLEQYSEEIGKSAARMLIERIQNDNVQGAFNSVVFKPKLIVRGSTLKNQTFHVTDSTTNNNH